VCIMAKSPELKNAISSFNSSFNFLDMDISQKKWDKAQTRIKEIQGKLDPLLSQHSSSSELQAFRTRLDAASAKIVGDTNKAELDEKLGKMSSSFNFLEMDISSNKQDKAQQRCKEIRAVLEPLVATGNAKAKEWLAKLEPLEAQINAKTQSSSSASHSTAPSSSAQKPSTPGSASNSNKAQEDAKAFLATKYNEVKAALASSSSAIKAQYTSFVASHKGADYHEWPQCRLLMENHEPDSYINREDGHTYKFVTHNLEEPAFMNAMLDYTKKVDNAWFEFVDKVHAKHGLPAGAKPGDYSSSKLKQLISFDPWEEATFFTKKGDISDASTTKKAKVKDPKSRAEIEVTVDVNFHFQMLYIIAVSSEHFTAVNDNGKAVLPALPDLNKIFQL